MPATEAAPACPAPFPRPPDWRRINARDIPITFQLAPDYAERRGEIRSPGNRSQRIRARSTQLGIGEREGPATLDQAVKATPDERLTHYSRCSETVGGRPGIIDSFRGGGVHIANGTQTPSFDVHMTLQVASRRYVDVVGSAADRAGQEELLVLVRTVRVREP